MSSWSKLKEGHALKSVLEKITPTGLRGDILLSVFLLTTLSLLLIAGGFKTRGNSGDILIPYLSAQALEQGLSLHTQFHSVLGWMYHYLNLGLYRLIEHSHGLLKEAYLVPLSSVSASIIICLFYIAANIFAPGKERLHPVFLLVTLTVCLSPRWVHAWLYTAGGLDGMYSKHAMALLFIHAGICLQWYRALCKGDASTGEGRPFHALCLLQALILYTGFHYKITCFIGDSCLTLAVFFLMPTTRRRLQYVAFIAVPLLLMVGATALAGYSYTGYLRDLGLAAQAKTSVGFKGDPVVWFAVLFSLLAIWLPENNKVIPKISRILFSFLLAFGFFLSIFGITASPTGYIIVFTAICIRHSGLINETPPAALRHFRAGALAFIVFFCSLNIASSFHQLAFSGNKTSIGPVDVETYLSSQYLDIINRFGLEKKPDDFYILLSAQYLQNNKKAIIFSPYDDILSWNAAAKILHDRGVSADDTVGMVGFANPFPTMLHTRLPNETWHWKHQPINLPYQERRSIFTTEAKDADVFYMPVLSALLTSQFQSQVNCGFYTYNLSKNPSDFELFHVSPGFLLWGRHDFLAKHHITPMHISPAVRNKIQTACTPKDPPFPDFDVFGVNLIPYRDLVSFFGLDKTSPENFVRMSVNYDARHKFFFSFDDDDIAASAEDIAHEMALLHVDKSEVYISGTTPIADTYKRLNGSRFVVTPVINGRGFAQTRDNCTLLTSPEMAPEKFTLFKVTAYNLFWQKNLVSGQKDDGIVRKIIRSECQKIDH